MRKKPVIKADSWFDSQLLKNETGLKMNIWLGMRYFHSGIYYLPAIKVQNNYAKLVTLDCFAVTISSRPRIIGHPGRIQDKHIKEIFKFIKLNKELLLKYFNQENIGLKEIFNQIKKV